MRQLTGRPHYASTYWKQLDTLLHLNFRGLRISDLSANHWQNTVCYVISKSAKDRSFPTLTEATVQMMLYLPLLQLLSPWSLQWSWVCRRPETWLCSLQKCKQHVFCAVVSKFNWFELWLGIETQVCELPCKILEVDLWKCVSMSRCALALSSTK